MPTGSFSRVAPDGVLSTSEPEQHATTIAIVISACHASFLIDAISRSFRVEFVGNGQISTPGPRFLLANGQVSFYGTSAGRIFSYDRRTNSVSLNTVDTTGIVNAGDYGINRLTILSDTLGYALFNRWRNGTTEGFILRFDGMRWIPEPPAAIHSPTPIATLASYSQRQLTNPLGFQNE